MPSGNVATIYDLLLELVWHFGDRGITGECCGDLSLVEFMALKKAGENRHISIQDIGSSLNFTKSGATRVIDRLETKGYAKREHSEVDGRVCCVTVTGKGFNILSETTNNYIEYLEKAFSNMEQQAITDIEKSLRILVENLQKHDG